MNKISSQQLVTNLSRDVLTQIAPQEIPIFPAISEAYFKAPAKTLKGQQGKEDILGFGIGETVSILTPIVLQVSIVVVEYITKLSKEALEESVKESVKGEIRNCSGLFAKLLKSRSALFANLINKKSNLQEESQIKELSLLTHSHLREVRRIAFEKACQLNIDKNKAELLADALVGSLTVRAGLYSVEQEENLS